MHVKRLTLRILTVVLLALAFVCSTLRAQTFDAIKKQVKVHTLANGMKFIVLERHDAPVVSFHTYADVGSAQEVDGITGISHILEHMAFKGTKTVGTKDYAAESKLLDEMDQLYDKLVRERNTVKPDTAKIKALQEEFDKVGKAAQDLVVVQEYWDLIMKQGGAGLNAYTSNDATQYITSLPSNRLEFWMAMESDRFMNPVFREFFQERDVIMEERRLGLETQPTGKLIEDFFSTAFKAHPYHHSVVGHMSDLRRITRRDVVDYFHRYYSPSNLTVAIVGDVKADEVFKRADTYFGRIQGGQKPEPLRTEEPEQWGERRVIVEAQSQPIVVVGYHRPDVRNKDDLAFDALANIFGQGRSSRLYKSLVKEKKIAIDAGSMNGWPGNKYPNLFAAYAVPAKDHSSAECLEAIDAEIARLMKEPVTDEELTKYKRQTKKRMIDRMKPNSQMAAALTFNDVIFGDWGRMFDVIKDVDAVTTADVQAVAQKYLVKKNRTVGELIPEKQ